MALTIQQEQCADLLLLGTNKSDIAIKLDISRQAIYAWLKKSEFREYMDLRKKEAIAYGENYLTAKVLTYIEELNKIAMTSKDEKLRQNTLIYLVNQVMGVPVSKVEVKQTAEEEKEVLVEQMEKSFSKFKKVIDNDDSYNEDNIIDGEIVDCKKNDC